jgi:hypothetical protein
MSPYSPNANVDSIQPQGNKFVRTPSPVTGKNQPSPQLSTDNMSTMHCSLLSLGCVFGFAPPIQHATLSALRALKIAQRRLRPEVRAKLLSVSSARTDASLAPEAWRFVFLDPATSGNCRAVTVAAKTSSEHPDTVEAFSAAKTESTQTNHAIAQNKWVIDSDQALSEARAVAKLKGVQGAEYRLSQPRNGSEAFWTLSFYGEGVEPVARLQVGAKSGNAKILSNE